MYRFPTTLTKYLAFAFLIVATTGCNPDDDEKTPEKEPPANTGWKGTDNSDTIPANVNTGTNPFSNQALPASFDLTTLNFVPPVGDQGQFGTCVAWATAYGMKTVLEAVKFNRTGAALANTGNQLSPKDLFTAIDDNVKGASDCNGTNFTPALDVVLNRGVATMAVAPYTGLGNGCAKANLDPAWATSAAQHKISRYRKIWVNNDNAATIKAIKTELVNKSPVVLGAKLADNFMSWGTADAVYTSHSTFDNTGQHAYHAMLIVGYDDARGPRGAFKVLNSWATTWGNAGFIWIDQQFLVNGFGFGENLYTAANADQNPDNNPGPNPQPNPTGVDLIPWITQDYSSGNTSFPTERKMIFDLYNIGTAAATVSAGSGYAYIYYNAYNANDYGVVFFDYQSNQPSAGNADCSTISTDPYPGCRMNVNIPAEGSLGTELFNDDILRTYYMPSTLTGDYYLVMIADVNEKHSEQDENNNLFYTTDQYPIYFQNGIEFGRRAEKWNDALTYRFSNPLTKASLRTAQASRFRTAVTKARPNAYSPQEIKGFLKQEVKNGNFFRKLDEYKRRTVGKPQDLAKAAR